MAASSNSKATYPNVERLEAESEFQSSGTSGERKSSHRFNTHLGALKDEFEALSQELERLRKERDKYKAKVELQGKQLQNAHSICQRCNKSAVANVPPSQIEKQTITEFSREDDPPRQAASPSSQNMTLVHSVMPTQPSQSVYHPTSRLSHSRTVPSTGFADSSLDHGWSITVNKEVEKQFNLERIHRFSHEMRISCVRFSRDGKTLAAGCWDGRVYIYDVENGRLSRVLRNLLAERDGIGALCFSHDGKYLATYMLNRSIFIWDIKTKHVKNAFRGHTRLTWSLDFSPNGRLLVSASRDNTVRLWSMRDGTSKLLTEENPSFLDNPHYSSAVFSPDGGYIAASHRDGLVRIWDVRTGQLLRWMRAPSIDRVNDVKFMPDGKGLISGGTDAILRYWDVSSLISTRLRPRSRLTNNLDGHVSVEENKKPEREFSGHKQSVSCLAISPDSRWVASGSLDKTVRIWDSRNAAMQYILNDVHEAVESLDFDPGGRLFASGGREGAVIIWRLCREAG